MNKIFFYLLICLLISPSLVSFAQERGDPQPQDIINPKIWPDNGPIYLVVSSIPGGITRPNALVMGNGNRVGPDLSVSCVLPEEPENRVLPLCNKGDEELKNNGMYYNNHGVYIQCPGTLNSNQVPNGRRIMPQPIYAIKSCLRIQQAVRETWE